ncbi:sterol 3beta-glucosyltransferase [Streptoalloteichus tenebrarius]|uniref:Sterol 3beta-glucosyltransferase n=1 Tax=Streptoalloteichus tenebrarius (strain ATCC 17920 / DSM 40477 / JCM 4838 / CBS 697.72 / NBRC 16177 / NCIMB 11028 / NRRL B-12390 / A12253. 1 / ISP 5477) TaxID=1933 RepID=A0ABT1I474_STRSD|nr:glycosyltransferase [Streptoalloteichus tenebrarius]MCP2262523.1 sterol 3beta-glucosyltransferase [Streptoalloteichus tenebrarius]BFE99119.1 glycosyltransferase [Streptoalloteichus tenebrarius]
MRALLVTHGTRGDVQPFLALAVALRERGHDAVLAAPASFAGAAADHGVEFAPLDEGPNRLLDDPVVREAISGGYRGVRGKITAARVARRIKPLMADVLRDVGAAARQGADVVVHAPSVPAHHAAEMIGAPAVLAALQPGWVPTSAFPCSMVALPRLPRFLNRATYLVASGSQRAYAGVANTWRTTDLGLPRRSRAHDLLHDEQGRDRLVLQAFSPHVTPVDPQWPATVRTTGFWRLPPRAAWSPPPELARFLDDGPTPIYVGFGSMAGRDARRTAEIVVEAVRTAGARAVVATGWGGLDLTGRSRDVLVVDQVPHDWLFPRVGAVVHHGGGGTTAAALAAGRPQVVCPFVADQPHWAERAHALGVAPAPVRQQRLTADRLAAAITEATTDPAMRRAAERWGKVIREEDGVGTAVGHLEELLERRSAASEPA